MGEKIGDPFSSMSVRTRNILDRAGIYTVEDLSTHSRYSLCQIQGFGRTSLCDVEKFLSERGMVLGQRPAAPVVLPPSPASLRDWFAGMALPAIIREWCAGLVKDGSSEADFSPEADGIDAGICAEQAYEVADAMLNARGPNGNG